MKFLADENFNNDILRGVWRRIPDASFTRVQDTEIAGADDPRVLEYAAEQGYIILSHDVNTMRGYFYRSHYSGTTRAGVVPRPQANAHR
jgi:predicted nuclease of predicted toxin-antitoxin system